MTLFHGFSLHTIKGDLFGGITAAVVALPLALAFGVASGAGPLAGMWGAILVGFFAALFGGTPSQISGPTGPMTVVMTAVIMEYTATPALAYTVVMMGGALQIVFGKLRIGNLIQLVPYTVISGFMSGIGCIIIILQLAPLLGHSIPAGGTLGVFGALPSLLSQIEPHALILGTLALAVMILSPSALTRLIPAPLIALVLGTVLGLLLLPDASTLGAIPTGLPTLYWPHIDSALLVHMLGSALILALLGSIDSLLTSLIADNMTQTQHRSNRELIGQGIGNIAAGLCGAIPGAGATMRTVVNVRAGGRSTLSGMVHALVLLAVVLGLGPLASFIPHAVLAGILLKVGWDIIDWQYLVHIRTAPRTGVLHMLLVLLLTVFVDLIMAVGIGITVASLSFVKDMADLQKKNLYKIKGKHLPPKSQPLAPARHNPHRALSPELLPQEHAILTAHPKEILIHVIEGPMSFGAAKVMTHTLSKPTRARVIILDLSAVNYIDTSAAFSIKDTITTLQDQRKHVITAGANTHVSDILHRLQVTTTLVPEHQTPTRLEALLQAQHLLINPTSID